MPFSKCNMIFSTISNPSNKAIKQVYQLLKHTRQLLFNISLWSIHSFWNTSNEHAGSQLKTELTSFQSLSNETILWSPPWLLQFLMYLITEEYLSLKMATCMLGKHFVFVFLAPLKEGLHDTMTPCHQIWHKWRHPVWPSYLDRLISEQLQAWCCVL